MQSNNREATLEQLMRDMQAKVPKLRMIVAQAYARKREAEQDYKEAERDLRECELRWRKAVERGEMTAEDAQWLLTCKRQLLEYKQERLTLTAQVAEDVQKLLNDYTMEMDGKFTEIRAEIARHRTAEVQHE